LGKLKGEYVEIQYLPESELITSPRTVRESTVEQKRGIAEYNVC
jgi:hypothetical protein